MAAITSIPSEVRNVAVSVRIASIRRIILVSFWPIVAPILWFLNQVLGG